MVLGLGLALGLGLGLAAVAAWWARPTPERVLVVGSRRERGTLGALGTTKNLSNMIRPLVFEPLTRVDPDGTASPYAIAAVTPSDGERTWTLAPRTDLGANRVDGRR